MTDLPSASELENIRARSIHSRLMWGLKTSPTSQRDCDSVLVLAEALAEALQLAHACTAPNSCQTCKLLELVRGKP